MSAARSVSVRETLVVGLVEENAAGVEHSERDEGNAARDEKRDGIEFAAFEEEILDRVSVRIG